MQWYNKSNASFKIRIVCLKKSENERKRGRNGSFKKHSKYFNTQIILKRCFTDGIYLFFSKMMFERSPTVLAKVLGISSYYLSHVVREMVK